MAENAITVVNVTEVFVTKAVADLVEMQTELGQRGLPLSGGAIQVVCRQLVKAVTGVVCDAIEVK